MTFVLSVLRRKSIWVVTDRRISFVGYPPKDDADKVIRLQTFDAISLMAYCGLGLTVLRTEPSQWMINVLRGRVGTLDGLVDVMTSAAKKKIEPHLRALPVPTHKLQSARSLTVGRRRW